MALTGSQNFSSIVWDVRTILPNGQPILFQTQGTGASFIHRPDTTSQYIARAYTPQGCEFVYDQYVTVQELPKKPGINSYQYCQFEDATAITANSLEANNKLIWHQDDGTTDTVSVLPAPSTDTVGTFYRYVQQYNPLTGCVGPFDTATIVINGLPLSPLSKQYYICKDTPSDTLLTVDRGPYSQTYLSNLSVDWFDNSGTALDTIPVVPTSDTGNYVCIVQHVNNITGCTSPLAKLDARVYQVQVDSINYSDATCYDFFDGGIEVWLWSIPSIVAV